MYIFASGQPSRDSDTANDLAPELVERILARLGLPGYPEPTFETLRSIYSAWCRSIPFDNVRKLIHVRRENTGPLPGSTAEDFFQAWLQHGTGGTCWAGAGAMYSLLTSLGFTAARGVATMLAAPGLPPNHGTVLVTIGHACHLVDCSILHGEPLRLEEDEETVVAHPAWGISCYRNGGRWRIRWRPLHKVEGFECRLERFGVSGSEFQTLYEQTRGWSPFNYELSARVNRGGNVVGAAFGHAVSLRTDGSVSRIVISHKERVRLLIEDIGLSEEIVKQLPQDIPTPPPPGSRAARS